MTNPYDVNPKDSEVLDLIISRLINLSGVDPVSYVIWNLKRIRDNIKANEEIKDFEQEQKKQRVAALTAVQNIDVHTKGLYDMIVKENNA